MTPLNRTTVPAPTPPVRLVHLGLGAFHRAHQVYYTQLADPEWGYASFAGRGPGIAPQLAAQDGLYTLVTRSGEGDDPQLMTSLVEVHTADRVDRLIELLSDAAVAVLTLTVTEAGYHLREDLSLDADSPAVQGDLQALRANLADPGPLQTAAGRIVAGLAGRRAAGVGGMAVMSCDNIAANGDTTRAAVYGLAAALDPGLAAWIAEHVTFPSTSIDRITPATTPDLLADVAAATGHEDAVPVVTEPFASWVIEGEFPAGRPAWERAGVEFVTDIDPFERRKLWLLNGSHSLMAYLGQLRGHDTVAEAIADQVVRDAVEKLWDDAASQLTDPRLGVPAYRAALLERFANPRIRHNLAQIAVDGGTKQRMRAVAILRACRAAGRPAPGATVSIAAWIALLQRHREQDLPPADTRATELTTALDASDPVASLLAALDEELATDPVVLADVRAAVADL